MTVPTPTPPTPQSDDVVELLLHQHHTIRALLDEALAAEGGRRAEPFHRLVHLLTVHETAEEMLVHPYTRRTGEGAESLVDARLAEESEAKETLAKLEKMDPASDEFTLEFAGFREAVLTHAAEEERHEFPRIRAGADPADRQRMGKALRAAERVAPTRPHPGTATEGPVGAVAAAPLGLVDRIRDAIRTAGGGA